MCRLIQSLLLLPILLALSGCTTNRVASEITTGLDWAGLRSHSDLDSSRRWQISPGSRIFVDEMAPIADPRWLAAAESGIYQVFQAPSDDQLRPADYLLRIGWPPELLGADARGRVQVRLFLCDASGSKVVQATSMTVDPHWFSFDSARPDQIRGAFQDYAAVLSGQR